MRERFFHVDYLLRWGGARIVLLLAVFFLLTTGTLWATAVSEHVVVTAEADLSHFWRTAYDILVRPPAARSPIEEKHGLVEANHLSGLAGGISFAQYELIKSLPDVEVAAPIAMIGYVVEKIPTDPLGSLSQPGAYVLRQRLQVDNGARVFTASRWDAYYVGPDAPSLLTLAQKPVQERLNFPHINPLTPIFGAIDVPLLLAGIDPEQEAALIGLDRAVDEGEYFPPDTHVTTTTVPMPTSPIPAANLHTVPSQEAYLIPVLINATPYIHLTLRAKLYRLHLPPGIKGFQDIMARGGKTFLFQLEGKLLKETYLDSTAAYQRLITSLRIPDLAAVPGPQNFTEFGTLHAMITGIPGPLHYRQIAPPFPYDGIVLEIVLPEHGPSIVFSPFASSMMTGAIVKGEAEPVYRPLRRAPAAKPFFLEAVGVFDIEALPKPADVNRVPLETYYPPVAILRYDESGRPVPPQTLQPTLNPAGYILSPPLLLTTLEAAQLIRGEKAISAIRVRVKGIDRLTPTAQQKIEAVATEIHQKTGLTVDIMVGSSPRRILVHVPGIGYVEEQWVQKGVRTVYQEGVERGHWIFIGVLLFIGGLFALEFAYTDVVARSREVALLKALGWYPRTLARVILGRILWAVVVGMGGGLLLLWILAHFLPLHLPPWPVVGGELLLLFTMSLMGVLYPTIALIQHLPIYGLRWGTVRYASPRPYIWGSHLGYVWIRLRRRPGRTVASALAFAGASMLFLLVMFVVREREGFLAGTLLGEYITLHVRPYHSMLLVLGFLISGLVVQMHMQGEVIEDRWEIGLLKAVGWTTWDVARLFVEEGLFFGFFGGILGSLIAAGLIVSFYGVSILRTMWIWPIAVGVSAVVGMGGALYPAYKVAKMLPVEAMRYE